jgi:hypothetical protein
LLGSPSSHRSEENIHEPVLILCPPDALQAWQTIAATFHVVHLALELVLYRAKEIVSSSYSFLAFLMVLRLHNQPPV